MFIPIIFNVEAVNSQNEGSVGAARRGGVSPAIIPGKPIGRSSRAIPGIERRFSEDCSRRVITAEKRSQNTTRENGQILGGCERGLTVMRNGCGRRDGAGVGAVSGRSAARAPTAGAEWELVRPV